MRKNALAPERGSGYLRVKIAPHANIPGTTERGAAMIRASGTFLPCTTST
jgi:hypothetical protein